MIRVRFKTKEMDWRPVRWPIQYPYWKSGEGEDYSILIAYADNEKYITDNWPEAYDISIDFVERIVFTDRFWRPDWYKGAP